VFLQIVSNNLTHCALTLSNNLVGTVHGVVATADCAVLVQYDPEFLIVRHGFTMIGQVFDTLSLGLGDVNLVVDTLVHVIVVLTTFGMDKDRYRQSLGGLIEAYEEVAHRIGVKLD